MSLWFEIQKKRKKKEIQLDNIDTKKQCIFSLLDEQRIHVLKSLVLLEMCVYDKIVIKLEQT